MHRKDMLELILAEHKKVDDQAIDRFMALKMENQVFTIGLMIAGSHVTRAMGLLTTLVGPGKAADAARKLIDEYLEVMAGL